MGGYSRIGVYRLSSYVYLDVLYMYVQYQILLCNLLTILLDLDISTKESNDICPWAPDGRILFLLGYFLYRLLSTNDTQP